MSPSPATAGLFRAHSGPLYNTRVHARARARAMEELILCAFCAIFAQTRPNSRRNRPKTAGFCRKMRFFVRFLQKSLAILRKSRYNVPVTERE